MSRGIVALSLLALAGCKQVEALKPTQWPVHAVATPSANLTSECVSDYRPDRDYFPSKVRFERSTQLTVDYHRNYKFVRFNPGVDTGETQSFALVQCGTPVPANLPANTIVVEVPIKRLATVNEGMLGALVDIDAVDTLVGIPNKKSVTVPEIKAHIAKGGVSEVYGYGHSSIEGILALDPDVYLSFYSAYPEFHMHPTLWRLGVKALPMADHLESHPLGRAEWMKFLGLLTNRERQANRAYADIAARYAAMRAKVPEGITRPRVMSGAASARDEWELYGGDNYRSRLIHDAGGEFVFSDLPTANGWVLMPYERAYARGNDAPVWLGGPQGAGTYRELLGRNAMYAQFAAVRQRNVTGWDKGYIGYFAYLANDQSMTKPHWQLEDAIRVLHPELLPPGDFHFARSLQ